MKIERKMKRNINEVYQVKISEWAKRNAPITLIFNIFLHIQPFVYKLPFRLKLTISCTFNLCVYI